MVRQTSLDAYQQITKNNLLSKMRYAAYDLLYRHGPATANELIKEATKESESYENKRTIHRSLHKRLTELVQRGVATETQERECRITGRRVIEFDVTANLPKEPPKKKTKLQLARQHIKELERQNKRLTKIVSTFETHCRCPVGKAYRKRKPHRISLPPNPPD